MKPSNSPSPRNYAVDLVKTVAIAGVLLIHASAGGLSGTEAGSPFWLSCLFWNALARPAVPLFLMASGALLLPPERELTLKKLYTHNLPRLLAALFFWAAFYKLAFLASVHSVTVPDLRAAAENLLLFRHEEHLYYLHIMLLVYAFLPLTRLLAKGDRRTCAYALVLWFLLGILYPTLRTLPPLSLLNGIPLQWRLNMTYASIGYTLLGYYLTAYHPRPSRALCSLLFLAGFLLTFGGTWASSSAAGELKEHFLEGMGVGTFLEALGVWGLCQTVSLPRPVRGAAAFFSKASFCVFLTHIYFLQTLSPHVIRVSSGPALLTVPLLSALLLACGCGLYAVLSRIPVARSWLV